MQAEQYSAAYCNLMEAVLRNLRCLRGYGGNSTVSILDKLEARKQLRYVKPGLWFLQPSSLSGTGAPRPVPLGLLLLTHLQIQDGYAHWGWLSSLWIKVWSRTVSNDKHLGS